MKMLMNFELQATSAKQYNNYNRNYKGFLLFFLNEKQMYRTERTHALFKKKKV